MRTALLTLLGSHLFDVTCWCKHRICFLDISGAEVLPGKDMA